ncbi:MAG: hypothetical protein JO324_00780 [Candidatus Eremiobacteraeota bacterium]|nr:hypothetical protein [Candidatus Eremiobacteraeota bacterium]
MKACSYLAVAIGALAVSLAIGGCSVASGPAPGVGVPPPTATPAPAKRLYADHNGVLYEYALPLTAASKPVRSWTEWPGLGLTPVVTVDSFTGRVAVASPKSIRIFYPPIRSFAKSHARTSITLTPAITQVGVNGADLADLEYDPSGNLWLFNNLGAGISELRAPLSPSSIAALSLQFGAPGSKTAGFTTLVQGRFDINSALYVYALSSTRGLLFKVGFPYARPPGTTGLNVSQANFVDSSQWSPTAPVQPSLIVGQYFGQLASPPPGSPPPPPVNVLGEFNLPLNPQIGLFPNSHTNAVVGAVAADPLRAQLYTLDSVRGTLDIYGLPLPNRAKPVLSLPCPARSNCSFKPEHLFLAP